MILHGDIKIGYAKQYNHYKLKGWREFNLSNWIKFILVIPYYFLGVIYCTLNDVFKWVLVFLDNRILDLLDYREILEEKFVKLTNKITLWTRGGRLLTEEEYQKEIEK